MRHWWVWVLAYNSWGGGGLVLIGHLTSWGIHSWYEALLWALWALVCLLLYMWVVTRPVEQTNKGFQDGR
jgi:hypothetical protein